MLESPSAKSAKIVACFLIALFAVQAFGSLFFKSATVDEVLYIPAGYAYLKSGSFMLNPETPPLPRILCGIPLLFLKINYNPKDSLPAYQDRYHWAFRFLFWQNSEVAGKMIFFSRIPTILLGMALLGVIYTWSHRLFGPAAGIFSLTLAVLEPNLIAHSSLATTDLYTAAMIFFTVFSFWVWRQNPDQRKALLFPGLFLGLSLLSKSSAWLIVPVLFVLLWIRDSQNNSPNITKNVIRFVAILFLSVLVINSVFLFRGAFVDKGELISFMLKERAGQFWPVRVVLFFFPKLYSFSVLFNLAQSMGGVHPFPFYLNGEYSYSGFWNYFFVTFILKTPLPFLLAFVASLPFLFKLRQSWFILLPLVFFLLYFSFLNRLDLGLRYVLPIYAFLLVAAGALIPPLQRIARGKILVILLVLWSVVTAVRIYPHHLAYFNELCGGSSKGYKYLVDSNLDWGQDLVLLKSYMERNGVKGIRLSYYGMSDPEYYGIKYRYLPSPKFQPWTQRHRKEENFALEKGLYAISATNVAGIFLDNWDTYQYFRNKEPIDSIGYSILIYEIK
ncbi:glycosyltransferase family 39 protein [bacterium]|nr:glycosyltransferase family 39 protein [bacterium]